MRITSGLIDLKPFQGQDGYEILGIISEGRVFRISKARHGTKVVILKSAITPDSMSVEMLKREYELARSLSHPCVVSTISFCDDSPLGPAIVMEYIEGYTLDEYIAHCTSLSSRKAVLKDILDGVEYLHHRGVLHNDLKPDNIIVNSNGAARIIDFGLSGSEDCAYKGCIGGSEGYSAPEILQGNGTAGASSDIYSLGLIIRLMFGGKKYSRVASKCCKMLPSLRYQNVAELRKALQRSDLMPKMLVLSIVSFVVAVLVLIPYATKWYENYKAFSSEKHFEKELTPYFEEALELVKAQKYCEFGRLALRNVQDLLFRYNDSLAKIYPMSPTGEYPPEMFSFHRVFKRKALVLDSIVKSMPSIKTLPKEEQAPLLEKYYRSELLH